METGISDIAESKVQEARIKYFKLTRNPQYKARMKWHMVGHLQTNKVREAVRIFDLIQSVDNKRLAQEINIQAARIDKIQDILIEVNISGETTKFGFIPEEVTGVVKEISAFQHINIKGLMAIAPVMDNPEKTRPYFGILRELLERINTIHSAPYLLGVLSMGMTDDFEAAIKEGSTMVRLGRAIFEDSTPKSLAQ